MIDPAGGIFPWNRFANRKIQFAKIVRHQRPAHARDDLVILEEVCEFASSGPYFSDIGFQFDQFFLNVFKFLIRQVVEVPWVFAP